MPKTLSDLSFTSIRKKPKPGQWPRCFWNVSATGNFASDAALGKKLALEYLTFEEEDEGGPGHLNHIVADMPRPLTTVEHSFLQIVCFQAKGAHGSAARMIAYWRECEAREANHAGQ